MDQRHGGFLKVVRCADNLAILEAIIGEARKQRKERFAFLTSLDIKNAFGSVSHKAIFDALEQSGAPPELVEYISYAYSNSQTPLS